VENAQDSASDGENDEVPQEADGNVEVIRIDERKDAEGCCGHEGEQLMAMAVI
jgi:hypothetical protein